MAASDKPMEGDSEEVYDFAPPPAGPPQQVLPVTTVHNAAISYQSPRTQDGEMHDDPIRRMLPSWKLATALIVIGVCLLALPMILHPRLSGSIVFLSGHLIFRFGIALVSTCLLAWLWGFSFGEGGSYLLKLTAVVVVVEGTLLCMATLIPFCLMIPAAILASGLICAALYWLLFDFSWSESFFAAVAYWAPGLLLIFVEERFISWIVRLVT